MKCKQTSEEAQVYVHDLDLFVTVPILDDMLAVLSLGCASGQKPRADQTREEHFIPVRPFHRHRRTRQVHLQVQHQSEETNPYQETGAIHQKLESKIKKRDNDGSSDGRMRDLPEWLEGFTDNLKDTQVPAPAHISYESDSERSTNVASRKCSIFIHFLKDRNCEVCLHGRTPLTKFLRDAPIRPTTLLLCAGDIVLIRCVQCRVTPALLFLRTTLRTARRSYKSSSRTGIVAMMGTQRRQVKESLKPERRQLLQATRQRDSQSHPRRN